MTKRVVGMVLHATSSEVHDLALQFRDALESDNIVVRFLSEEQHDCSDLELVVVLGGDGTMLKAFDLSFGSGVPLLGLNFGRVGFLAEAEGKDVFHAVNAIVKRQWRNEERVVLAAQVIRHGVVVEDTFALNDVALEKAHPDLMAEIRVSVDEHDLMAWAGDGVVLSTPTGSTAYAFSAGGPVVWPTADVMLVVPISAHALFARPLVIDPSSTIRIEFLSTGGVMTADGRRRFTLQAGDVVRVVKHPQEASFARINAMTFTERLVTKFQLPTQGWRETHD